MPVSRSTGEETNFVPGQAVFELTMHQCIEAGQAFDCQWSPSLGSRLRSGAWSPSPGLLRLRLPLPRRCLCARLALASHEDCAPP